MEKQIQWSSPTTSQRDKDIYGDTHSCNKPGPSFLGVMFCMRTVLRSKFRQLVDDGGEDCCRQSCSEHFECRNVEHSLCGIKGDPLRDVGIYHLRKAEARSMGFTGQCKNVR